MAKTVFQWDGQTYTNAWVNDLNVILHSVWLPDNNALIEPVDLDEIAKNLEKQSHTSWAVEAYGKEKLKTFNKIHDFDNIKHVVKNNLSRSQRSLVFKVKAPVLSLKMETGRFKGTDRRLRFCDICKAQEIEDEIHHLISTHAKP